MARKPGLGGKTERTIFKKTINQQQLLEVSSIYSCLHAESMKHVHFLTLANTHISLLPSARDDSQASKKSPELSHLDSSIFGVNLLISNL